MLHAWMSNAAGQLPSAPQWTLATRGLEQQTLDRLASLVWIDVSAAGTESDVVSACRKGLLMRRGGATDVSQQGRVINIGGGPIVQSESRSHADGDEAPSYGCFGRIAHAEISDEGQGGQQVCAPQRRHYRSPVV